MKYVFNTCVLSSFPTDSTKYKELSEVIKDSIGSPISEKVEGVLKSYELPYQHLMGAFIVEKLIAIIGFEIKEGEGIIRNISVLEKFRRAGIGKSLINKLIMDFSPNVLRAETDYETVDFYRRIGFKCVSFESKYGERFYCFLNLTR